MEYSEAHIQDLVQQWQCQGFTEWLIIDKGMFYALKRKKHFAIPTAIEVGRHYFSMEEEGFWGSLHALRFIGTRCKGLLLFSRDFYDDWELTPATTRLLGFLNSWTKE